MIRKIACIVGQSNENGRGLFSDSSTNGCPLRDPVAPYGSSLRSMWPRLAEMMAARGVWLNITNTARGSTSLTASWCGRIDAWVSGIVIVTGHYILANGGLWKCNNSAGTAITSTVAPTGTTSYTTSDTVVWIYVGVPTGADIAGTVCAEGHARFDPLGYIAAAYATLSSAVGYDEKWMFLSIGQTDKTISTVSADFTTAYINVTNYFLARGIKCALGFTCYAATTGTDAWYTSNLLPGYENALANYSGNANVVTGANLRSALGVLTVSPTSGAGLQSDQLHMNDQALNIASEAWYSALLATGIF